MSTDDSAQDDSPAGIIAQLAGYDAPRLAADPQARMTALALSKTLSASLEDPETYAMATALARTASCGPAGHQALTDPSRGILQRAFPNDDNAPRSPYEVLEGMPAMHRDFNAAMAVGTGQPEPWFRLFPTAERLLPTHDDNGTTPLLVDVAGGRGHDLQAFHAAFRGRVPLVLQDLPDILDTIPAGLLNPPAVTAQAWDFFGGEPQPVRRVLHQWPDGRALRILGALREAMLEAGPRGSTLLMCDAVLPDVGAPRAAVRTRHVVKIWQTHPGADGVNEAVVGSSE
ncbi:O-methyltransferase, family 2 [Cordyceps fumosorosea ARSEF 2679]|uniref:O-methyltransferase, family 2 n=1 Tax=Cordyceps fumosorosea (strain ARSEF 2679) TaxID=1081104 RepID=A0A167ZID2_CORFA|nr:O-methyltransferase, family 2 [Cordyceps fumosorosea ARSEF 2679]OAA67555.1 O-methyltransferase, family 2 [Cordyceps fumosorosea ARSEF 2679]